MSNPNDPYVERTVVEEPAFVQREVITERRGSSAGWWIAALVALAAVVGLFMVMGANNERDLVAARQAGHTEAMVSSAATDAQRAATSATEAASAATSSMASAAGSAGRAAADDAHRAAASAADSAADASATVSNEVAQ